MSGLGKFGLFLVVMLVIVASALWIIGGRPNKASAEVWISAEPDVIFSCLVEPEKRKKWVRNLESTSLEVDGSEGTPVKYVSTFREGDRTRNLDELIQQHDSARFLSLKYENGGVQTMKVFRLEPEGQRVRLTYEVIEKALNVWRLTFALQGSDLQTQLQLETTALKNLAEKNSDTHFLFGDPVR